MSLTTPPIPSHLTADCFLPYIPEKMIWAQLVELQVDVVSALIQCNHDKKAIREIERDRYKNSHTIDIIDGTLMMK